MLRFASADAHSASFAVTCVRHNRFRSVTAWHDLAIQFEALPIRRCEYLAFPKLAALAVQTPSVATLRASTGCVIPYLVALDFRLRVCGWAEPTTIARVNGAMVGDAKMRAAWRRLQERIWCEVDMTRSALRAVMQPGVRACVLQVRFQLMPAVPCLSTPTGTQFPSAFQNSARHPFGIGIRFGFRVGTGFDLFLRIRFWTIRPVGLRRKARK
jgi:hypothetical protein